MFRRRAPQALALGSASFGHVLRTETLGLKRNLHFTSTPAKTSFVQPASRGWAAKRSNFRESKLHFSSQSRPSESRASLPLAIAIACTGTAAVLFVTNAWQKVHAEGEPQSNEEEGFFSGLYKKVTGSVSEAFNSSNDSLLLPDPDPAPYTKKYTVVIADDALLARSYSLREGFATKKRPGVEYFLATLAALDYEVVLWSLQGVQVFGQMMEKVDPNHHAPHRLFLDATVLSSTGKQLKDLGRLNRHLSKVIAVDVDREGVTPQENLVIVPKYTGKEPKDTTLIDMIPFFKLIAHGKHGGDLRVWAKDWNEKGPKHFQDLYADAVRKYQQRRDEEQQQRGNRRSDQEEDDTAGPSRSFWRR